MKKIIAILPIVIFLVSVAFASASLNINETNINATANPGATFSKQITLINTESSPLAVTFSGLDLFCGSEKITATTSAMTIPANSTAKSSILFSIPANKLACAYHGNIIAQAGSFADGVTADITVTAVPNIDVSNRSVTLMKNLSSIVFLNAAVKNTGNVPLNIVYQYSNFSRSGKVLEIGSVGSDVVPIGDIHYISIPLVTPDNSFGDGDFTSILKINGTIDRQYGLTATVKTPALTVSLPDFTMPEADRNTTVTGTFTIKNNGDFPLSGITLSTDANSKYHVEIVDVPDALSPGEEATVSITVFIPKDEKTTAHEIGNLLFKSDLLSNTVPLSINVTGKLKIEEISVTIDGSKKTIKENGGSITSDSTQPGSTFDVDAKVCNKYDDKDDSISDIEGTLTFEGVDEGSDIDGEVSSFDLDGNNNCKTVTATFDKNQISYLTGDGDYDLTVEFTGSDDNHKNIDQSDEWTISIRVSRETSTKILLNEVSLSPSAIGCGSSVNLYVLAYNIGDRDSDAKMTISSSALGIDMTKFFKIGDVVDDNCDAIENPDDKCVGIDHSFSLSIPVGISAGTYPIDVAVYKGTNAQTDKKTVNLAVSCNGYSPLPTNNTNTGNTNTGNTNTGNTNTGNTNTGNTGTGSTGGVIIQPSPNSGSSTAGTPVKVVSVSGTNGLWVAGLIAGNVLLVIIIILVLLAIFRSKAA